MASSGIPCSDQSEIVDRSIGIDNSLLAFRPFDALPMLHAQHSVETFRVDVAEQPELTGRYGVLSFPSLLFLDHRGEEYYRITGFRTVEQMTRELAAAREAAGP